jgi:hypothetical protein
MNKTSMGNQFVNSSTEASVQNKFIKNESVKRFYNNFSGYAQSNKSIDHQRPHNSNVDYQNNQKTVKYGALAANQ